MIIRTNTSNWVHLFDVTDRVHELKFDGLVTNHGIDQFYTKDEQECCSPFIEYYRDMLGIKLFGVGNPDKRNGFKYTHLEIDDELYVQYVLMAGNIDD